MKIGNVRINKLKKLFGVNVPESVQDKPEKALEFVVDRLRAADLLEDKPAFIKEISEKFGNPLFCQTVANTEARMYIAGFYSFRSLNDENFPEDLAPKKRHKFTKDIPEEHEKDLVELMGIMRRNPYFIPHYA